MKNIEIEYQLTSLQQTVVDLAKQFEESVDVRYEIFAYGQTRTAWKLSREEVEEFPIQFKHLPSATWLREAARGYFLYLEYLIGMIRGEYASSFVLPEDIFRIEVIGNVRSEWLRLPVFREAVENLVAALQETLDYFNVQLVCILVREALHRSICQRFDDKPSFDLGLPWAQVRNELQGLEDAVYCRARTLYHGHCKRACEAMMGVRGVDGWMLAYFIFSYEQLMTIAAHNRGGYAVNAEKIVAMDPQKPEPVPQWKETPIGLIVPGDLK